MRAEESRVLVVAPVGRDAEAMAGMLRGEGVMAEACAGAEECLARLEDGAGVVLLTEEALELPGVEALLESFGRQPAWSELPLIILTSGGESRFERLLEIAADRAGAVTLLERPMRVGTLLHSVQVALRSRRRQYEVRELLVERERAAEVLRESEERFKLATEGAGVGLWDWNIRTGRVYYSPRWKALFGYEEKDIGESVEDWARLLHPEDREWVCRFQEDFLAGTGKTITAEYRLRHKDGSYRWIGANGVVVRDEKGQACRLVGSHGDITARKEAERAVRESRERLLESERRVRTFFTSDMMGAIYWNMDGQITDANSKFLEMVGYTRNDLVSGRVSWRQMTPPEYGPQDEHALEELRTRGVDTPYEKEYLRRDGTRVPILIGAAMLDDKRYEGVAFVLDITERKRAQEALRESHERLKRVVDTQTVGVMFWDLSTGCMVDANETFLTLMGYSRREVEARELTWEKLTPPEYLEVSRAEVRKFLATGRVGPYEKEYFRKDGTRVWLLFAGSSLGKNECVEFCVDISDRKKAEAALRQASERLTYHVQNTPLAVVEFDAELKVCAWSGGAERMFGWKAAEVLGRPMWEIGWICEEDRGKVAQVSAGLESGRTARSVSPNRNLRKDGQVIWCEWYNSSITDGSGKMQSILSLVLDVTKRKEAEAVLARDKEQLERLVAERTAELRELVGELEHFSYSITHDMRAPLRAMMGFAEVVKELCSGCGNDQQKVFLERIQTAARRMDLLITDALNYSKAVRSELPLAPMDVGRLLRGMVDTYPELQGAQGGIRIEPELPLVMGNEAGLTQCFSNLLVNAVKFAKPGEAPQIRVWAEVVTGGQGWVRIWVEDKGIGISKSMLPRVFDMFSRGTNEQAGTGIGLALVRKVVERMGGRVGVESEEGRGSRFWVELRSGDLRRKGGIGALDRPGAIA